LVKKGLFLTNYFNKFTTTVRDVLGLERAYSEKSLLISSQSLSRANSRLSSIEDLHDVEFSVYSQWGEDGIIDWLVSSLPEIPQIFVEFGVENYRESNTRLLLKLKNWRGLVLDGSQKFIRNIRSQDIFWRHQLAAKCAFVDRDNINQLLDSEGVTGEIGLLSIDIDGNDYWVWQAITVVSPAIVIVEYNAVFGDLLPLTVPYRSDFIRNKAHFSNLYFGASLPALLELGEQKGYKFIGTNSSGINAFFVRNDLADHITGRLAAVHGYPSLFREARDKDNKLTFTGGEKRADLLREERLMNLRNGEIRSLKDWGDVCSPSWKAHKRVEF
jgi:hypothetical protein